MYFEMDKISGGVQINDTIILANGQVKKIVDSTAVKTTKNLRLKTFENSYTPNLIALKEPTTDLDIAKVIRNGKVVYERAKEDM